MAEIDPFEPLFYRKLRDNELQLARSVFRTSIPLDKVRITGMVGANGMAYAYPGSMVAGAVAAGTIAFPPSLLTVYPLAALIASAWMWDKYLLNMGSTYFYVDLLAPPGAPMGETTRSTFIHELTHVWQGHNRAPQWGFVVDSLANRCLMGEAMYDIDETNLTTFAAYNAEQQGKLIERYMQLRDAGTFPNPFECYVRDNIRPPAPYAATNLLQFDARWWGCLVCHGLVQFDARYTGQPGGPPTFSPLPTPGCRVGGSSRLHQGVGSPLGVAWTAFGQAREGGWKRCANCRGLFKPGEADVLCGVTNSAHAPGDSPEYFLTPGGSGSSAWSQCKNCGLLYRKGTAVVGRCPDGGDHVRLRDFTL